MKIFFLSICFLLNAPVIAQIDIGLYSVDFQLTPNEQPVIKGKVKVKFRLEDNAKEIRLRISKVNIDSLELFHSLHAEYKLSENILIIPIESNKIKSLSELTIYFSSGVKIDQLDKNYMFVTPYLNNDLAVYKISAKLPKDYEIYSNCLFHIDSSENEFNRYLGQTKNEIMRASILIAPKKYYNELSSEAANIPIRLYYKDGLKKRSMFKLLEEITNALKYYTDSLGTYLYDKLYIIEDTDPAAFYINSQPGLIIASSSMITQKYSQWSYHEVAHQWFGSGIYFLPNEGWPIAEPLAEMLKIMCLEKFEGTDISEKYFSEILQEYKMDYIDSQKDAPLLTSGSGRITYLKGPIIYSKLRECLGENRWMKFLRELYLSYKRSFLTMKDFQFLLEEIDSECTSRFRINLMK